MIQFNKLDYGMFPFGSLSGRNVFYLDLLADEKPYKSPEEIEQSVIKISNQMKDYIEKNQLEDQWMDALLGIGYLVFTGKDMMSEENIRATDFLYVTLSHISYEVQKEKPAWQLRPLQMCFIGQPEHFTGSKNFYENFNLLYVKCPLYNNGELVSYVYNDEKQILEKDTTDINEMALAEMKNHSFAMFYCVADTEEEVKAFYQAYVNRHQLKLPLERSFVACHISSFKKLLPIVSQLGIRIFIKFPSIKGVIKLIE